MGYAWVVALWAFQTNVVPREKRASVTIVLAWKQNTLERFSKGPRFDGVVSPR